MGGMSRESAHIGPRRLRRRALGVGLICFHYARGLAGWKRALRFAGFVEGLDFFGGEGAGPEGEFVHSAVEVADGAGAVADFGVADLDGEGEGGMEFAEGFGVDGAADEAGVEVGGEDDEVPLVEVVGDGVGGEVEVGPAAGLGVVGEAETDEEFVFGVLEEGEVAGAVGPGADGVGEFLGGAVGVEGAGGAGDFDGGEVAGEEGGELVIDGVDVEPGGVGELAELAGDVDGDDGGGVGEVAGVFFGEAAGLPVGIFDLAKGVAGPPHGCGGEVFEDGGIGVGGGVVGEEMGVGAELFAHGVPAGVGGGAVAFEGVELVGADEGEGSGGGVFDGGVGGDVDGEAGLEGAVGGGGVGVGGVGGDGADFSGEDFGVGFGVVGDLDAELGAEVGDVGVGGLDGEADGGCGDVGGHLADGEVEVAGGGDLEVGGAFDDDVGAPPRVVEGEVDEAGAEGEWGAREVLAGDGRGGGIPDGVDGGGEGGGGEARLGEHEGDEDGGRQQQHGRHRPHPSNRDGRPCCTHWLGGERDERMWGLGGGIVGGFVKFRKGGQDGGVVEGSAGISGGLRW